VRDIEFDLPLNLICPTKDIAAPSELMLFPCKLEFKNRIWL